MADILTVNDELRPGDLVDIRYQIIGTNEAILDSVILDIKRTIYADPRFDYQSSKVVQASDLATGKAVRFLVVTVSMRAAPKAPRETDPKTQEASVGYPAVVLTGIVVGGLTAIVYMARDIAQRWGSTVEFVSATVREVGYPSKQMSAFGWGAITAVALVVLLIWKGK